MFDIKEELKKLPDTPGVYIMHDAADSIIYVGKAVNLKRRVSSYFQTRPRSPKIEKMISLIDHFEFIVVKSEMEALALECNLIKENRPKYNTMLMDDKTYPFVKVTVNEKYPRVFLTRRYVRDKAKYFGPFTNVGAVRDVLKVMRAIYRYRVCDKKLDGNEKERPCLYYQMGQCSGPCGQKISPEDYRAGIDEVLRFFEGDGSGIKKLLRQKMLEYSDNMEFEKAAEYRDMLRDTDALSQVQRVTAADESNRDCVGLAVMDGKAIAQIFFIRCGKMVGREPFLLDAESDDINAIMTDFVKQFYGGAAVVPREILLSENINDAEAIEEWLSVKAGAKVHIITPQKGRKEKLVELAKTNAEMVLHNDLEKLKGEAKRTTGAIEELGRLLGIEAPARIESYDISNTSGFESVGSMVVYEDGKPKKSDYRRFRIKTVTGPDDYASMNEVLSRRIEHYLRNTGKTVPGENTREKSGDTQIRESFEKLPDLILMDGGRGQVNICLEVCARYGIELTVCGMVKDDRHRTRGIYFNNEELPIDTGSEMFKLITRIQDETHRFAIEYHKSLRSKEQVKSVLDDIPGIGAARKRALMTHFDSLEAIKNASAEELAAVPNMNRAAAESLYGFFRKKPAGQEETH